MPSIQYEFVWQLTRAREEITPRDRMGSTYEEPTSKVGFPSLTTVCLHRRLGKHEGWRIAESMGLLRGSRIYFHIAHVWLLIMTMRQTEGQIYINISEVGVYVHAKSPPPCPLVNLPRAQIQILSPSTIP
jgi:hypothetical protein